MEVSNESQQTACFPTKDMHKQPTNSYEQIDTQQMTIIVFISPIETINNLIFPT